MKRKPAIVSIFTEEKIKWGIFTKWNSLEIKEVVPAAFVVPKAPLEQRKPTLVLRIMGAGEEEQNRAGRGTSNTVISISIRQINSHDHPDAARAQWHISPAAELWAAKVWGAYFYLSLGRVAGEFDFAAFPNDKSPSWKQKGKYLIISAMKVPWIYIQRSLVPCHVFLTSKPPSNI